MYEFRFKNIDKLRLNYFGPTKIRKIDSTYFLLILVNLVVIAIFVAINSFMDFGNLDSGRFDYFEFKEGIGVFLVMGVTVFPFFEEVIHRSYVSKRNNFWLTLLFLLIYFFLISDYSTLRISIFLLYAIYVLSLGIFLNLYQNKVYLLFFTSLFFAVFHIFKFDDFQTYSLNNIVLSLFPQFFSGLILFISHSRYGFWAGVIHHGLLNLVLIFLILGGILFLEKEMSASLIAD